MARLAAHVGRIVECATAWAAGITLESALRCRRRPRRRPCGGRLYLRRSEVPSAIVWICPLCADRGMIQHFARTRADLSALPEPPVEDCLLLPERAHQALWDAEPDLERRALLARGMVEREGIRVEGSALQVGLLRALGADRPDPLAASRRRARSGERILRLRIALQRVRPPVWRRIELPEKATLAQLHRVLQAAMGWSDAGEHRFRCDGEPVAPVHERRMRVASLLARPGDRLLYDYEVGEGWAHEIRLEEFTAPEPDTRYPRCVQGRRACPPEGVGGPWRYAEILAGRAAVEGDPCAPALLRLCGRPFDPDAFDADSVNSALRRLRL